MAVTEDPGQYRLLRARLGRRSGVTPAIGMHPLHAHSFGPADIARFLRLLPQADWIGEIGLDFSRAGQATRRPQMRVLEAILADPHLRDRPVTVHSRGAEKETIAALPEARVPAILHWYTGPLRHIDDALAADMKFSINTAMATSTKGHALIKALPPSAVLLETDGPFAHHHRRPSTPSDLPWILGRLTDAWQMPLTAATATIITNQKKLPRPCHL